MLKLRDYQITAIEDTKERLDNGLSTLLQSPTGAGKTEMALSIIESYVNKGERVLFIAHREELVTNIIRRSRRYGMRTIDMYSNGRSSTRIRSGLFIHSIMKVYNRMRAKRWNFYPKAVIFDEAHRAVSPTWEYVIQRFQAKGVPALGLTATPWRANKREGFTHLFTDMVTTPQTLELIQQGYLSPVRFHISGQKGITSKLNEIGITGGDYNQKQVEARIGSSLVTVPVNEWEALCKGKHKTLIHAANRRAALEIAIEVKRRGGNPIVFISSSDNSGTSTSALEDAVAICQIVGIPVAGWGSNRKALMQGFEKGKYDTAVHVNMFTEGIDVPDITATIFGRPTLSRIVQRQQFGRGLRKAENKKYLLAVDCAGVLTEPELGNPLADYEWSLEARVDKEVGDAPENPVCDTCQMSIHPMERHCKFCAAPNGSICPACREWRSGWYKGTACELGLKPHSCAAVLENYIMPVEAYKVLETAAIMQRDTEDLNICPSCLRGVSEQIHTEVLQERLARGLYLEGEASYWSKEWANRRLGANLKGKYTTVLAVKDEEGLVEVGDYCINGEIHYPEHTRYLEGLVVGVVNTSVNRWVLLRTGKTRMNKVDDTKVRLPDLGRRFRFVGRN